MAKYLALIDNIKTEVEGISTTTGVSDANKIVQTNEEGYIDISLIPSTSLGITRYVSFTMDGSGTYDLNAFNSNFTTGSTIIWAKVGKEWLEAGDDYSMSGTLMTVNGDVTGLTILVAFID